MSDNNNIHTKITEGDIAYLNHARNMLIHTAELRVKNFNFFLIVASFTIAAFAKFEDPEILRLVPYS